MAHSAALHAAGLITAEEHEKIVAGLNAIGAEIEAAGSNGRRNSKMCT